MRARINKSTVDRAASTGKDQFIWDTDLKGFGIRVSATGQKTYVVQYRAPSGRRGKTRRITIGRHGSPWTPDGARKHAIALLADAARGGDPAKAKRSDREAVTLAEFADRYLNEHAIPHKKPRSVAEDRRNLQRHILPRLGGTRVRDLAASDIAKLHNSMSATKPTANRCVALLSKMLNLAEQWGEREFNSNPCRHVKKFREQPKNRYLGEDERARLIQALNDAESAGVNPNGIAIIRLLMVTGARRNEISALKWDEVDLERGRLFLRDSKTGSKIVLLNSHAAAFLSSLCRLGASSWVFPAERGGSHYQGLWKAWKRIRVLARLEDIRLHDLRHSFASVLAGQGKSLHQIGQLLGHRSAMTTHRYAHLADDPLRQANEDAGQSIFGS